MEKLDGLEKEDTEFHNFLSGARSTSHYSKKEAGGGEKMNSTTGFSKHSGAATIEYSSRQQKRSPAA